MNKMAIAALLFVLLSGCSSLGVQPWERDVLAREDMQLVTDPVEAATDALVLRMPVERFSRLLMTRPDIVQRFQMLQRR